MGYEVFGEHDDREECQSCESAAKDYAELDKIAEDMAILVRRLSKALRRADPDNSLPDNAMEFLERHDFRSEPLR